MKNLFVAVLLTLGLSAISHASQATNDQSQVVVSSPCANPLNVVLIDSATVSVGGRITLWNKAYGTSFGMQAYSSSTASFGVPHHFKNQSYDLIVTGNAIGSASAFSCSAFITAENTCPKPGTDAYVIISQIPGNLPECVVIRPY